MATYKIQQGQSLGQIARDNNTTISNLMSLNPQIKNPNLIYAGQDLVLPATETKLIGPVKPVATSTPGQIDLNIVANTPVTQVPNTTIEPVKPETIITTQPTETQSQELTDIDRMLRQRNELQTQVSDIETKIANRSKTRDEALTTAGVYDDIKTLSDLKTKQQNLEEEARLYLVGKAGTKAGLASLTNLESRQALLQEQQLQNRVNTNLSIIDEKLKADNDAIDTLYKQKIGLLDNVSKNYSDLLTEQEKIKLEDRKFQQQLILDKTKSEREGINKLITNAASQGAPLTLLQKALEGQSVAEVAVALGEYAGDY